MSHYKLAHPQLFSDHFRFERGDVGRNRAKHREGWQLARPDDEEPGRFIRDVRSQEIKLPR